MKGSLFVTKEIWIFRDEVENIAIFQSEAFMDQAPIRAIWKAKFIDLIHDLFDALFCWPHHHATINPTNAPTPIAITAKLMKMDLRDLRRGSGRGPESQGPQSS